MARIVAVVDDLMFGSRLVELLGAAGHEVTLVGGEDEARRQAAGADVLVVDLAGGGVDGIGLVEAMSAAGELEGRRTLAVYSHVEADVARRAREAGFDAVVPRSRMVREGADLVGGTRGDDRPAA